MMINPEHAPWIVWLQKGLRPNLRIFCFHYAGGGASFCRSWRQHIPRDWDLISIQLPGREQRIKEPFFRRMPPLIDSLLIAIQHLLDKPYVLLGHSMGTIISYELARALKRTPLPEPIIYFPCGRRAPHCANAEPHIHDLEDDNFSHAFLERNFTNKLKLVMEDPVLKQFFLPQLKADTELVETYKFLQGEKLNCPISAFAGEEETGISTNELEGWACHTTSAFRAIRIPGDHFFIEQSESLFLDQVCGEIKRTLSHRLTPARVTPKHAS